MDPGGGKDGLHGHPNAGRLFVGDDRFVYQILHNDIIPLGDGPLPAAQNGDDVLGKDPDFEAGVGLGVFHVDIGNGGIQLPVEDLIDKGGTPGNLELDLDIGVKGLETADVFRNVQVG